MAPTPAPTHPQRARPCARKHVKDPTGYTVLWSGYWGIFILQINELLPKTCLRFPRQRVEGGDRDWDPDRPLQPSGPSQLLSGLKTGMDCTVGIARVEGRSATPSSLSVLSKTWSEIQVCHPQNLLREASWAQALLMNCGPLRLHLCSCGFFQPKMSISCFSIPPPSSKVQVQILLPPHQSPWCIVFNSPSWHSHHPQTEASQNECQELIT